MKILLAVDGSSYTKKMLAYLVMHGEFFSAHYDYTIFTVQPQMPLHVVSAVGKDIVRSYHADEAESVLSPVSLFLVRHGIDAKSSWRVGQAAETIAKLATTGRFDLILMGSHGHGSVVNLVMGSVATKVLANCKVPVLLIR